MSMGSGCDEVATAFATGGAAMPYWVDVAVPSEFLGRRTIGRGLRSIRRGGQQRDARATGVEKITRRRSIA